MSLYHSIIQFKKPIGRGASRLAFYSKRHKVVVKIMHDYCQFGNQNEKEFRLWESLDKDDRRFLPILDRMIVRGQDCLVMEKCYPIDKLLPDLGWFDDSNRDDFEYVAEQLNISEEHLNDFLDFVDRYGITDLHPANFGLNKNGDLVVIDAGLFYGHEEYDEEESCEGCCETCGSWCEHYD